MNKTTRELIEDADKEYDKVWELRLEDEKERIMRAHIDGYLQGYEAGEQEMHNIYAKSMYEQQEHNRNIEKHSTFCIVLYCVIYFLVGGLLLKAVDAWWWVFVVIIISLIVGLVGSIFLTNLYVKLTKRKDK